MIVVIDTNVIVSGVLKPYSKAAVILRLIAEGAIRSVFDLRILAEYRDVLNRPKFNMNKENIQVFLTQFEEVGLHILASPLKFRLPDPDDEPFLEVALTAGAVAVVTGNKRHFPASEYCGVKILSPAEFLKDWTEEGTASA